MLLHATAASGRSRFEVAAATDLRAPTILPAEYLTFEVDGAGLPDTVYLDGRELRMLRNDDHSRGWLMIDAAGSVGYHCLRVRDVEWYFATEDAKLKLEGILRLLDYVGTEGLGWGGQLFFSDGTVLRHAKVDYAWLEKNVSIILNLADEVSARPARRAHFVRAARPPGPARLYLADTYALLRRSSRSLLEEDEEGALAVGDRRHSPRIVVAGVRERSFDIVANRRVVALLEQALTLADCCRSEPRLPKAVGSTLAQMGSDLRDRLDCFPFTQLRIKYRSLPDAPSPEEIADSRYRATFDLYEEISRELAWQPGMRVASRLAYVARADEIYQAFVALVLARAFDAPQVSASLLSGLSTPVFRSDAHDLYYDAVPPRPEFANWRDGCPRPSEQRPDLTIVDRTRGRGILADAKYRLERNGRLPATGVHDAQVYLQSFECKSIVIFYPGSGPSITRIAASGYTILEVAIGPYGDLETYVRTSVRPAIEEIMEPFRSATAGA